MRKLSVRIFLMMCLTVTGSLSGQTVVLEVPLFAQRTGNWCWAASEQMISTFLGHEIGQCDQVNSQSAVYKDWSGSTPDCCPASEDEKCQFGSWPWFDTFTYRRTASGEALSWESLKEQIRGGRPVGFSWKWTGGGGHMMVARGFSDVEPGWVIINDPYFPVVGKKILGDVSWITYADYVSDPEDHTHWYDFYDVTYVGDEAATAEAAAADQPGEASVEAPPASPAPAAPAQQGTEPLAVAGRALETIRALLSATSAAIGRESIGFTSAAEVDQARLGRPIPVSYIWMEDLLRHRPRDAPDHLLEKTHELIYPVEVDGKARALVVVEKNQDRWEVVSVGTPRLAQTLESAHEAHAADTGQPSDSHFLIKVPALYETFIGHRQGGKLFLSPLDEQAARKDEEGFAGKGLVKPAGKWIKKLLAVAKENRDGLGVPVGDG